MMNTTSLSFLLIRLRDDNGREWELGLLPSVRNDVRGGFLDRRFKICGECCGAFRVASLECPAAKDVAEGSSRKDEARAV